MTLSAHASDNLDGMLQLPVDVTGPGEATRTYGIVPLIHGASDGQGAAGAIAAWGIFLARYLLRDGDSQPTLRLFVQGDGWPSGWVDFPINESDTLRGILIQGQALTVAPINEVFLNSSPMGPGGVGHRAGVIWRSGDAAVEGDAELFLVINAPHTAAEYVCIAYDTSRFQVSIVERFVRRLTWIMHQVSETPEKIVAEIDPIPPQEREWLYQVGTGADAPRTDLLLVQQFERWAAETPDAIALVYRDSTLTYRDLNRLANRCAKQLILLGVGPELPVIVCLEPSFAPLIALVAIWKAGGVYVPLDPTYPPARVQVIIAETAPRVIVTRTGLAELFGFNRDIVVLLEPEQNSFISPEYESNQGVLCTTDATASIYFTSGTTGVPKGVMANHGNLAHYIQVARERYGVSCRDKVPAIARFGFSISMFELMLPLTSGGQLVILDREEIFDFPRLAVVFGQITFFHAGPSLLKGFLPWLRDNYRGAPLFAGVRHASSGGDMIAPEVLEDLKHFFPNAEVFVVYGCSEISCMGCTYPVPREKTVAKTFVGAPFPNMTVRVVDSNKNILPVGEAGEILFSGDGVVKGYLGKPELTSEKFVTVEGRRFYCTGDGGRIHPDGWVEILGRSDFQIQLRGMRIELGEIEFHLRRAPGVRDGVVMARTTSRGEQILVAYVVMNDGDVAAHSGSFSARVRQYVTEQLPDYMVPSRYIALSALPLNHNLKVDRRALPEFVAGGTADAIPEEEGTPKSASEIALAGMWTQILGEECKGIRITDNFFELGGDSLRAWQLLVQIKQELGVVLTGMEILREPLEVLALLCDERRGISPIGHSKAQRAPADIHREVFYFGPDESLYGVCYRATRSERKENAVLIVGPPGHEQTRVGVVVQNVVRQMVLGGATVLRFDYFGCGDSWGASNEGSCSRWEADILAAYDELVGRAGTANISALGVRLGGTLLSNSANCRILDRMVLWDPILSGEHYYHQQRALHRSVVGASLPLRWWRRPTRAKGGEELLGHCYSATAVRELRTVALAFNAEAVTDRQHWLITSNRSPAHSAASNAAGKTDQKFRLSVTEVSIDCHWDNPAAVEELIPDTGISRKLSELLRGSL